MSAIFDRVLNLIKKTGDRVIIVEEKTENAYVVMNFDAYEKIVKSPATPNLTELRVPDKIDKINQDIALWSEEAKQAEGTPPAALPVEEGSAEEENQFYFEPVE